MEPMASAAAPSFEGLPDVAHFNIASYLKPCRDLTVASSLNRFLRRVYLDTLTSLSLRPCPASEASLACLMRATGRLEQLELWLGRQPFHALDTALRDGEGQHLRRLLLYVLAGYKGWRGEAEEVLRVLHFPGLPNLRVLDIASDLGLQSVVQHVVRAMGPTTCPLLDELVVSGECVRRADVGTLAAVLDTRAEAGCAPLRRFEVRTP